MTMGVDGPGPQPLPRDLIARAEEISSTLIDLQGETEKRTFYSPEIHNEFTRAGFYRILVPKRYGGFELDVETIARVAMTLARGCPSTGWMYLFGAAHALAVATLFNEQAQTELFESADFICPATVIPSGTAERVGDDWIISGTWQYCSGAPYATHYLGHALVSRDDGNPPEPLLFVAPRSKWTLLDDWGDQHGLRGSGSHSIRMDGARVPAHFTVPVHISDYSVRGGTPGRELHGNPQYGGGQLSFMLMETGILSVGMAKGALDAFEQLMRSRTTMFPPIVTRAADPDYQFQYGEATGMIAAAEAAILNALRQWTDTCAAGPEAFTREHEIRLAMISREVVRLCWRAVEAHMMPTAGSSSVRNGERLERVWRDMSMLHSHVGLGIFLFVIANRELSREHFNVT